jgi:hypothetical protein
MSRKSTFLVFPPRLFEEAYGLKGIRHDADERRDAFGLHGYPSTGFGGAEGAVEGVGENLHACERLREGK